MNKQLTRWREGEVPSATHLNEPLDIVDSVANISATGGLTVGQFPNGTVIGVSDDALFADSFVGIVTSTPPTYPEGQTAFTDERYWIKPVYINSGTKETDKITFAELLPDKLNGTPIGWHPVPAINLCEKPLTGTSGGTHLLADNTPVRVFAMWDGQNPARRHYFFFREPQYLIKIVSAASGGGKYNGQEMKLNTTTVSASGNLTEAELGTVGTTVLVLNAPELGQSTHDLTSGTAKSKYFKATRLPCLSSDSQRVYVIAGFDWENCS